MAKNYFGITDTGKMRSNNEDAFITETISNGKFIAACVIDGVGGYAGGEVAAKIARDAITDHLNKPFSNITEMMQDALATANENIYKEKQQNTGNEQMACVLTLALADVEGNKFYYAHVGDTRLYLYRDGSLIKVTHDHSFVGYLEESGRLSEEAAMRHPKRNEINKALGFDAQINRQADYIEIGDSPFLPDDTLLLCSDGLSDMVGISTITSILKTDESLQFKCNTLIEAANRAGGKDNITVVLVHNNKPKTQHKATKPIAIIKKNEIPKTNEVVKLHEAKPEIVREVAPKKNNGTVSILAVLCFTLLGAFLFMLYKNQFENRGDKVTAIDTSVERKRTEQEIRLIDSINNPSGIEVFLINSSNSAPIVITDSIRIQNDSLHIIGNGATFKGDSTYVGPAFSIAANCKYILLDSLTFENFDMAVLAKSSALHLKNVQFKNCRVPVAYQLALPNNTSVSGRFVDTIFYNSDTLR